MKQLAVLAIGIFLTGALSAQVDTIPPVAKKPLLDTMTPVKRNTMDTMRKKYIDTIPHGTWKNDSAGTTAWNPAVAQQNADSMQQKSRELKQEDSSNSMTVTAVPDSNLRKKTTDSVVAKIENPLSDRVMMKEGEMFIVKNGEIMKMDKAVTLPSGLVVSTDGTVSKKGAKPLKLKEGQYIEIKPAPVEKPTEKKPTAKKTKAKNKQ